MWPVGGPGKRSDVVLNSVSVLVALLCLPGLMPQNLGVTGIRG